MNVRELRNFIKIIEVGSLSKASALLNLAQPSLGLQVRNLEIEFKQVLLERHARGVAPTEAGLIVAEHARNILEQIKVAKSKLEQLKHPSGRVSIGMSSSANQLFLSDLFVQCKKSHPNLLLDVIEGSSGSLIRMTRAGELQLACVYSAEDFDGLVYEKIIHDEWALVDMAKGQPVSESVPFKQLDGLPLILPSGISAMRQRLAEQARKDGIELNVILELQSQMIVKQLVERGIGYTVLPLNAIRQETADHDLRARRIIEPSFSCPTFIVTTNPQMLSPGAQAVRLLLMSMAQSRFPEIREG